MIHGSTETMINFLVSNMPKDFLDKFYISNDLKDLTQSPNDKPKIFWCQEYLTRDEEYRKLVVDFLELPNNHIVFVTQFQRYQYLDSLNLSDDYFSNTFVLKNAIEPFAPFRKPDNEINLIYCTTPNRGLDILMYSFVRLAPLYNIHLNVFGDFYPGFPQEHKIYFHNCLYLAKNHPKCTYHGWKPNNVVKEYMKTSHIFSYPCTYMECSPTSLIEAMGAGLICVHSDLAAIWETSAEYTEMYKFSNNFDLHVDRFTDLLEKNIVRIKNDGMPDLQEQVSYINRYFSYEKRIQDWKKVLNFILEDVKI